MTTHTKTKPLLQITDPDCRGGFEEAQLPCFRDCKLETDIALVEVTKGFLTEIAEEGWLTEPILKTRYRISYRYPERVVV